MCKKSVTLAALVSVLCLSETVVIIEATDEGTTELYHGVLEDLDPYYMEGKNPVWMAIRGKHVEYATIICGRLHIYIR